MEDSPAEKAGVLPGDVITAVNGTSAEGMTTSQVIRQINGSEDGKIRLELLRNGEPLTLEMELGTVEMHSVESRMLEGQTGYIQITNFTGVTPEQFQKAYQELTDQGMEKLVIDLRIIRAAWSVLSAIRCGRSCRKG